MEDFETYRTLLFSIAYRMTGSASEAEDIVQEAYLRYRDVSRDEIRSLKSYLTTVVTRLCLDYLKSARVQREQYVGPWLPEPLLTEDRSLLPSELPEQRESITTAFLVLLEKLTPPERAVFLLHEIFDYPFQEIAEMIDKSPANCRQLFHRAKQHLEEQRRSRFTPSEEESKRLLNSFLAACQSGNLAMLTTLLAQDATSWSDGGGKVRAALRPIIGRDAIARFWLGLTHQEQRKPTISRLELEEVNGQPAFIAWGMDGRVAHVYSFHIVDEQIHDIYVVLNPDKLAYIQQQIDAVGREGQYSNMHTPML